mgnify:CR=1 FL=1
MALDEPASRAILMLAIPYAASRSKRALCNACRGAVRARAISSKLSRSSCVNSITVFALRMSTVWQQNMTLSSHLRNRPLAQLPQYHI